MASRKLPPVHPGDMLLEEFMKPLGLTASDLARRIGVPPNRVTQWIQRKRAMTADSALRLEAVLGWPAQFWLRIQAEYDLELARRAGEPRKPSHLRAIPGRTKPEKGARRAG
jgi:addiction module HigA family antidote